jgi:hypothetical protein
MAKTKYTYQLTDFPNSTANSGKLYITILESSDFTCMVDSISTSAEKCDIWFRAPLSPDEWATLSGIVAEHDGEEYVEEKPAIDQSMYGKNESGSWVPMRFTDDGRLMIDVQSSPHGNELHTVEFATVSGVNAQFATISGSLEDITDTKVFDFCIRDASKEYFEINSTDWTIVVSFPFPGTDYADATAMFTIVASRPDANLGWGECRLYDFTNNQVILDDISWSAAEKQVYNSTNLQNLPTDEAVFEVQLRKQDTNQASKIRIHSCALK